MQDRHWLMLVATQKQRNETMLLNEVPVMRRYIDLIGVNCVGAMGTAVHI